ncbi:MAG: response regulator [Magnetococcales bacterium]|nr:response regulator [Magnetococcales bacterium]
MTIRLSLFLLLIIPMLAPINLLWAESGRTIKVGVYQNRPGVFTDQQGKTQGFYIDLLEEAASREGWKVQYIPGSWSQNLQNLEKGDIDLQTAIAFTTERTKKYSYTRQTAFANWGQLYVSDPSIDSLLKLRHKTIAGLKDDIYTNRFQALLKQFDIPFKLLETTEYAEALRAVTEGRADAGIVSRANGLAIDRNYDLVKSPIICCPMEVRYATLKGKNEDLLKGLDRTIKQLKQEKSSLYYLSFNRWFSGEDIGSSIPRWILLILGGFAGLLVLFVAGNLVLSRQVKSRTASLIRKQEELVEARQAAEAGSRAKSQFLANMSHEIRTPMNAVVGFTELALMDELTPKVRDYLMKSSQASHSLMGIINDILDFSKIESGKMDLNREPFNLHALFDRLADLFCKQTADKGLELILSVDPKINASLIGDTLRLEQVLINLIRNAIKFTDQGLITVQAKPEPNSLGGERLIFLVQDTGVGITPDQLPKVFGSFVQAEGTHTRKFGGAGLGLAICKRLVALQGGDIWVESEHGQGSTFFFTAEFLSGPGDDPHARPSIPNHMVGTNIVLVDGNASKRELLHDHLSAWGFESHRVANADLALEALASGKGEIQAVILDDAIPAKDMQRITAALSQHTADANENTQRPRTLVLSRFGDDVARWHTLKAGVDGWLDKPLTTFRLLGGLLELFGHVAPQTEIKPQILSEMMETAEKTEGARVLVVDDNPINQQVTQDLLQRVGIETEVANNGQEAVDQVFARHYNLVLMDLQMPVMDGYEACRLIRANADYVDLPIIALTAHTLDSDERSSIDAGMNAHLAKPIRPERLFGLLTRWIGDLKSIDQNPDTVEDPWRLPKIPGMKLEEALQRVAGNQKLLYRLLTQFREEQSSAPKLIQAALDSGDIQSAMNTAHDIKGVAANLGLVPVHNAAESLESALRENDQDNLPLSFDAFLSSLNQVFSAIGSMGEEQDVQSLPEGRKPPYDIHQTGGLLAELALLLELQDVRAVKMVSRLGERLPEGHVEALFEKLHRQVRDFRFKGARKSLHRMAQMLNLSLQAPFDPIESQRGERLLIVDDQPANLLMLAETFYQFRVSVARNGEQALALARAQKSPPDLILLDIIMPGMDGYEVCRQLREDPKTAHIPIIFITGIRSHTDEAKGLELGAADYIIKPFSPPIMLARVKAHLALSQQRRQLEERVISSEQMASVGMLASGMAHEINNPLASVLLNLESMKMALPEPICKSEEIDRHLTLMERNLNRSSQIVREVLTYAGQNSSPLTPLPLNEVLESALELTEHRMGKITLESTLENVPEVEGLFSKLEQVFINILNNAVDALPHGGVIRVNTRQEGNHVVAEIHDNGTGISKEQLEKVFDPFFTTKKVGQGTGLGLSVCYGIIRQHHGTLELTCPPGEGVTATIRLPIHQEVT